MHCCDCGCEPVFAKCMIISTHGNKVVREVIEASFIGGHGDCSVSLAANGLAEREIQFLRAALACGIG